MMINIGDGICLNQNDIFLITDRVTSAPVKRLISLSKETNNFIDFSSGKKVKTYIFLKYENKIIATRFTLNRVLKMISEAQTTIQDTSDSE